MNDAHITFRKIVIGASTGLMGAVAGGILVKVAISEFAGAPLDNFLPLSSVHSLLWWSPL